MILHIFAFLSFRPTGARALRSTYRQTRHRQHMVDCYACVCGILPVLVRLRTAISTVSASTALDHPHARLVVLLPVVHKQKTAGPLLCVGIVPNTSMNKPRSSRGAGMGWRYYPRSKGIKVRCWLVLSRCNTVRLSTHPYPQSSRYIASLA